MELEAISGAATVALTSTIAFLLIAKTWNVVSRSISSTPSFSDRIMHEAAQRFRDELDRLSCSQSTYLSGALVFVTLFVAAYVLQAKHLFAGYPSWQLYLQMGFLLLVSGYAAFCLGKIVVSRHQLKFLRDANIAIGHQLQQMTVQGTRVFHDVGTSAGIVDHVIIGRKGLYAINVLARRPGKRAHVKLRDNFVEYSDRRLNIRSSTSPRRPADYKKSFASYSATKFEFAQYSLSQVGTLVSNPAMIICWSMNGPSRCSAAGMTTPTI